MRSINIAWRKLQKEKENKKINEDIPDSCRKCKSFNEEDLKCHYDGDEYEDFLDGKKEGCYEPI